MSYLLELSVRKLPGKILNVRIHLKKGMSKLCKGFYVAIYKQMALALMKNCMRLLVRIFGGLGKLMEIGIKEISRRFLME